MFKFGVELPPGSGQSPRVLANEAVTSGKSGEKALGVGLVLIGIGVRSSAKVCIRARCVWLLKTRPRPKTSESIVWALFGTPRCRAELYDMGKLEVTGVEVTLELLERLML